MDISEGTSTTSAAEPVGSVASSAGDSHSTQPVSEGQEAAVQAAVQAAVESQPYSPDYRFKVMGEEREVDEWIRPAIKNRDVEKKVKELYEKAYGLDSLKQRHTELKATSEEIKSNYAKMDAALKSLGSSIKEGDFDSVFSSLHIPSDKIISYALELVKREQMTPEQKAQFEYSRQARDRVREYEAENARLLESHQQLALKQRTFELDKALELPEAKAIAELYNSGTGEENAFRKYVIQIGQFHAAKGNDISAEQAVSEAMRHLKAMSVGVGQRQQAGGVVQPTSKPTIPTTGGRSTSAVRPAIKSLDDLKKRAREISGQDIYN